MMIMFACLVERYKWVPREPWIWTIHRSCSNRERVQSSSFLFLLTFIHPFFTFLPQDLCSFFVPFLWAFSYFHCVCSECSLVFFYLLLWLLLRESIAYYEDDGDHPDEQKTDLAPSSFSFLLTRADLILLCFLLSSKNKFSFFSSVFIDNIIEHQDHLFYQLFRL